MLYSSSIELLLLLLLVLSNTMGFMITTSLGSNLAIAIDLLRSSIMELLLLHCLLFLGLSSSVTLFMSGLGNSTARHWGCSLAPSSLGITRGSAWTTLPLPLPHRHWDSCASNSLRCSSKSAWESWQLRMNLGKCLLELMELRGDLPWGSSMPADLRALSTLLCPCRRPLATLGRFELCRILCRNHRWVRQEQLPRTLHTVLPCMPHQHTPNPHGPAQPSPHSRSETTYPQTLVP